MINPIKSFRAEFGLTQHALASLAGVTDQVVLKAEQGLYPTIQPSIESVMVSMSKVNTTIIRLEYEKWIEQELKEVKLPPSSTDEAIKRPGTFDIWMVDICTINNVDSSINSFCKLLKLHPYVIQKWASGRMKHVPVQLVERVAFIRSHHGSSESV